MTEEKQLKAEADVEVQYSFSCPFCKMLNFFDIDELPKEMSKEQKNLLLHTSMLLKNPSKNAVAQFKVECHGCKGEVTIVKLRW